MRRSLRKIEDELRLYWANYVGQSCLGTLFVLGIMLVLSVERRAVVASIGATTFIVFAMPGSITAGVRNVVGGHMVGFLCGLAACGVRALLPADVPVFAGSVLWSAAVGLTIFLMVVLDMEHPPAAGTALGVAILGPNEDLTRVGVTLLVSVVVLSAARIALRKHLRDLV